jgi:hypothetical protein
MSEHPPITSKTIPKDAIIVPILADEGDGAPFTITTPEHKAIPPATNTIIQLICISMKGSHEHHHTIS